jgi:hypothetical protein
VSDDRVETNFIDELLMQVDESKPIKVHPVIVNDLLNQSIVNWSASEIQPIDEFLKQIDEN